MPIKKKKVGPKRLETSGTDDLDEIAINIHGAATAGKTWFALSASDFWPKNMAARTLKSKWVDLKDVLYVAWDRGGLVGLLPQPRPVRPVLRHMRRCCRRTY